MLIRRLRYEDYLQVIALMEASKDNGSIVWSEKKDEFRSKFRNVVMSDRYVALGIVEPKELTGYIIGEMKNNIFNENKKTCTIEAVSFSSNINTKKRKKVFQEFMKICKDKKCPEIELSFTQKNIWLEDLTMALGFGVKGIYRHKVIS